MNLLKYYLTGICLLFIMQYALAVNDVGGRVQLKGRVTDKKDGSPVPGVSIYFPDLKKGTLSKVDGSYEIDDLPPMSCMIQISSLGFKLQTHWIDLSKVTEMDFRLEESITELNEVVVTGLSGAAERNRTPATIAVIPRQILLQNAGSNLIESIARIPGVNQISTGPGISKPVIRGLGYNRVLTVNDGIRQEGQQWGDEHGIELDAYTVDRVEVLKGPASLAYGSDAMAGVIHFLPAPVLPRGNLKTDLSLNYQTNNGLYATSLQSEGNLKGWIWNAHLTQKAAHTYQNAYDGFVLNSGFREEAAALIFGISRSWGYMHLHSSYYRFRPGIVEGERDSLSGDFVYPLALNDSTALMQPAGRDDFLSYKARIPYQEITHSKVVLNSSFQVRKGLLKAILGWQQNQRKEFGDVLEGDQYGLYFMLNSWHYDVRYNFPELRKWELSLGSNGMVQRSLNKGTEFLVPAYRNTDAGLFVLLRKNWKTIGVSGGIRYDRLQRETDELLLDKDGQPISVWIPDAQTRFTGFRNAYGGWSGSLGLSWQLSSRWFVKANISRGFRAPNIAETGANGEHEGTLRYEIGNSALKPEISLQADVSVGVETDHFSAQLDVFHNAISNFIFLRKLQSTSGTDSLIDGIPGFTYVAGDAMLSGGELSLDLHPHPLDWLHFENSFSYVLAQQRDQPDSSRYLPFTPPGKFTSELKATTRKLGSFLSQGYVKLEMEHYLRQDKIYTAYGTETETPAYTLFNAGAGADIYLKARRRASVYLSINNLTNVAYQHHLSRLKYAPENPLTGRTGVYNMGRNLSFKVIIPIHYRVQGT